LPRSPSRCHPRAPLGFNHVPPWLHACHPWPRTPSTGGTRAALRPQSSSPSRRSAVEDGHPSGGFPTSIICSSTTQQPWRRRAGGARPRGHDARDWRGVRLHQPARAAARSSPVHGGRSTSARGQSSSKRSSGQVQERRGERKREGGRENNLLLTNFSHIQIGS
jgi:hypothetical protein